MDASATPGRTRSPFDTRLSVLFAALAVVSLVILVVPQIQFVEVAPGFDTAINTAAALVTLMVAASAWFRYREHGRGEDLFEAVAFAILLASGLIFLLAPLAGFDRRLGMSLAAPTETPVYVWTFARILAVLALIVAGQSARATRGRVISRRRVAAGGVVAALALAAFVAASAVALTAPGVLPAVLTAEAITRLSEAPLVPGALPGITPFGVSLEAAGAALFLFAAVLYARAYRDQVDVRYGFFAAGLLLAAFSQLHMAIYPGAYTSLVTTSDLLRLAFYAVIFAGIQAQGRADIHVLRDANAERERLREADVERATLEERARLAREVHDGLAQDLWFAKLKVGRLADIPGLPPDAAALVAEVVEAVDAGLSDAREAVGALRASSEDANLDGLLGDYLRAFGAQSELEVEYSHNGAPVALSPHLQGEIMRIAQEALTNVRRHADATTVRVRTDVDDHGYRLTITDNGRGFLVRDTTGYGLGSMHERASAIGAALAIDSEPQNGTTVILSLPLAEGSVP